MVQWCWALAPAYRGTTCRLLQATAATAAPLSSLHIAGSRIGLFCTVLRYCTPHATRNGAPLHTRPAFPFSPGPGPWGPRGPPWPWAGAGQVGGPPVCPFGVGTARESVRGLAPTGPNHCSASPRSRGQPVTNAALQLILPAHVQAHRAHRGSCQAQTYSRTRAIIHL